MVCRGLESLRKEGGESMELEMHFMPIVFVHLEGTLVNCNEQWWEGILTLEERMLIKVGNNRDWLSVIFAEEFVPRSIQFTLKCLPVTGHYQLALLKMNSSVTLGATVKCRPYWWCVLTHPRVGCVVLCSRATKCSIATLIIPFLSLWHQKSRLNLDSQFDLKVIL